MDKCLHVIELGVRFELLFAPALRPPRLIIDGSVVIAWRTTLLCSAISSFTDHVDVSLKGCAPRGLLFLLPIPLGLFSCATTPRAPINTGGVTDRIGDGMDCARGPITLSNLGAVRHIRAGSSSPLLNGRGFIPNPMSISSACARRRLPPMSSLPAPTLSNSNW